MKLLVGIVMMLLWATVAQAQILTPSPQGINAASGSITDCVSLDCAIWKLPHAAPSFTSQITGTMTSLTLTAEGTTDGQTWFAVMVTKLGTGVVASTTTSTGQYAIQNNGLVGFRWRCTTYVSGGANVSLTSGSASGFALPQDISTTSTPTFAGLTLTGPATPLVPNGTTYVVAASGGDFTTVQDALAYVNALSPMTNQNITIQIADGTYANTTNILINGASRLTDLRIEGQHTYAKTMSSVQSSSGSAGAWSIVLNVNSVANIAVNDWVTITNPSGGTLPTYIAGAHKVTNVDAVNTRITIASVHLNATAPSGAVSATVTVIKSILTFTGTHGLVIWDHATLDSFGNFMLVGDGTTNSIGLNIQDNARAGCDPTVGIAGFYTGVEVLYSSELNCTGALVVTGSTNANIEMSDAADINTGQYSVSSGSPIGARVANQSVVTFGSGAILTGNVLGAYVGSGSLMYMPTSTISGNTTRGVTTFNGGYLDANDVTESTNANASNRFWDAGGTGLWTVNTSLGFGPASARFTTVSMSYTAPTIASGGCTSPAVTWANGTTAFLLTLGSSCTGVKTITLTMPTATNFWACDASNNTSDAKQALMTVASRATSATAVVLTSYSRTAGTPLDYVAADTLLVKCSGG